jgi:hypothetical protein
MARQRRCAPCPALRGRAGVGAPDRKRVRLGGHPHPPRSIERVGFITIRSSLPDAAFAKRLASSPHERDAGMRARKVPGCRPLGLRLLHGKRTTDNLRKSIALVEFLQIAGVAGTLNISAGIRAPPFEVNDASSIHIFAELVRSRMSALLGWIETIVNR